MDINKLGLFGVASKNMKWLGARQKVVAENISNSDTPGYRARDVRPFEDFMQGSRKSVETRTTHEKHITRRSVGAVDVAVDRNPTTVNPNGNTVSLEEQTIKSAETREHYNLAASLYKKSADMLKVSIGAGR